MLEKLMNDKTSCAYNLGNGNGFSVQEVIDAAREVTGKEIIVMDEIKRDGDPAVLVADAAVAKLELVWMPQYSELATIIEHAWQWELKY